MITSNIIGYSLSATSGKQVYSFNPASQHPLPNAFSPATNSEVDLALRNAHEAWRISRTLPDTQRAQFLRAIADGIETLNDDLVNTVKEETAYPEARIIVERTRTCAQLRMFADLIGAGAWREVTIDEALPDRKPSPRPEMRRVMMPIGPVVVFGASNFPLAYSTAGGDVASALAVGCPVIVKAHESHLQTNALIAEVMMNAARTTGMPDGMFSSLVGDGIETGKQLILHPLTAAVGFTGSLNGGRALFDLGNQRDVPIPVFAEMGSVNPIFIYPGAIQQDITSLVAKLISSMTMTVGQFCTNPGILVVVKGALTDELIGQLKIELQKIQPAPMLNPGMARSFHKSVDAIDQNNLAQFMLRSESAPHEAAPVLALCDETVFLQNTKLHQEIFGPYTLIVQCENAIRFHRVAEMLEGQLTASVFAAGSEFSNVRALVPLLAERAGRIIYNGVPTGVEVAAAMTHGGPYPASTDSRFTAVGHSAIRRWLRPVTYQQFPKELLSDF